MKVGEAREIGREWVREHLHEMPELWGVMFNGSTVWMPEDAELGPYSDVDIAHIQKNDSDKGMRVRKIPYQGVVLETGTCSGSFLETPEAALTDFLVSISLLGPSIIYDPLGKLAEVQKVVVESYAKPEWAWRRCQKLATEIRTTHIPWLTSPEHPEDRVIALAWVVAEPQFIPLIACVKPLTTRKIGVLFTEMMSTLGRQDLGELRFELLGSARMSKSEVEALLSEATPAYDRAVAVWRTPTLCDNDLWSVARTHVIGGARDMIDRGYHREAIFWISYLYWLAHSALRTDAREEYEAVYRKPYERFTESIGIGSAKAVEEKARLAERLLDRGNGSGGIDLGAEGAPVWRGPDGRLKPRLRSYSRNFLRSA